MIYVIVAISFLYVWYFLSAGGGPHDPTAAA